MNTKELFAALEMLEKEQGIPMDYMIETIAKGIEVACNTSYGGNKEVAFNIISVRHVFDVRLIKTVDGTYFVTDYEFTRVEEQKTPKRKIINIT